MTARRSLSTKARVSLLQAHGGVCHICGGRIHAGEAWEVSHPHPLEMGGKDEDTNRAPAHKTCHRKQTSEVDIPMIAKAKRREARHIGARAPSKRPMPGGRGSRWKKKINGEVVERTGR